MAKAIERRQTMETDEHRLHGDLRPDTCQCMGVEVRLGVCASCGRPKPPAPEDVLAWFDQYHKDTEQRLRQPPGVNWDPHPRPPSHTDCEAALRNAQEQLTEAHAEIERLKIYKQNAADWHKRYAAARVELDAKNLVVEAVLAAVPEWEEYGDVGAKRRVIDTSAISLAVDTYREWEKAQEDEISDLKRRIVNNGR
jgi:Asp-tRNA(Asn)/Glu-tRNA(Gln) amidotransferase A subunit family amidase